MSNTFICVASTNNEKKEISIGIGRYNPNGNHTYFKETRKLSSQSEEKAHILAVFTALGKIEELGLKEAKLFHTCSSLNMKNEERMKKYPQLLEIKKRIERMNKKGFIITFKRYSKKESKHKFIRNLRSNTLKFAKGLKVEIPLPAKIIPIRPDVNAQPAIEMASNTKAERVKTMVPKYRSNDEFILVDHRKHVIDFLTKQEIDKLIRKNKVKKINQYSYRYIRSTYEAHRDISWLNVKQLDVSSLSVYFDSLLPFSKRKYTKVITNDGYYTFVISKKVAERLVKEKCATYTSDSKKEILLEYGQKELRISILNRDKRTCQYCGKKKYMTLEHVHPKNKGGLTTPKNCVAACSDCNSKKGDLDIVEYYEVVSGHKFEDKVLEEDKISKIKVI